MNKIEISLTQADWQIVIDALVEQPFKTVVNVINQIQAQYVEATTPKPVPEEPVADVV